MNVAWFHCFSGIAGDMALGSLVDAGADLDEVRRMLETAAGRRLGARGRAGAARRHRRHGDPRARPRDPRSCGPRPTSRAWWPRPACPSGCRTAPWRRSAALAEAEGRLHRRPPEQVHFHEVGGIDAIVDVVGTCVALELLDVDEVRSSAVATGIGMVRSAHGHHPEPGSGGRRAAAGRAHPRASTCRSS